MDQCEASASNSSCPSTGSNSNSNNSNANAKLGATFNHGEDIPPASSPATSISSVISEQSEAFRNSPYHAQSPLSAVLFQRPDFLSSEGDRPMSYPSMSSFSTNVPDSENSSRSSVDGYNLKDTTSEKIKQFRENNKRKTSNSSSEEEPETEEGDPSRKLSSKSAEDKFVGRGIDAPRGRIANIRRESSCSVDSEAAHERLTKASQQVSTGFDDIALDSERSPGTSAEFRRRAPSFNTVIGEPISVVTNAFIPHSCSPSPTRQQADLIKQCYSPSTQQMVRPNISYSPSPRESPAQSPTRHAHKLKFQRAESPICRQPIKRKLTVTTLAETDIKRLFVPRSNTSPLVTDKTFPYPQNVGQLFESASTSSEFSSFS
ncbi:Protein kinase domain-containing protein [Caenorhabditis elegans]|nr:Protein kinase domain-containing protein [Caenorhabditis elegans]CCD71354.1 Protein kinase domain-containing protein [Caenorhabditis elegans]|eukprot:NP_001024676.1 Uncharacterized protein CELE_F46H5.2 [Caenorhabditis elegans]